MKSYKKVLYFYLIIYLLFFLFFCYCVIISIKNGNDVTAFTKVSLIILLMIETSIILVIKFNNKVASIILNSILTLILVIIVGISISFANIFGDKKEITKLNLSNNENIYLILTSWGNDERMAIGLDDDLEGGYINEYPEKYNSDNGSPFFYKASNDSLYIYGNFSKPKINKFKTHIIFKEMDNVDYLEFNKKYIRLGFRIFPASKKYIIDNASK